jgi:hypothetical protein
LQFFVGRLQARGEFVGGDRDVTNVEHGVPAFEVVAHLVFRDADASRHEGAQFLLRNRLAQLILKLCDVAVDLTDPRLIFLHPDEPAAFIFKLFADGIAYFLVRRAEAEARRLLRDDLAAHDPVEHHLVRESELREVDAPAELLLLRLLLPVEVGHSDLVAVHAREHFRVRRRVGVHLIAARRVEQHETDAHQDGKRNDQPIARPLHAAKLFQHLRSFPKSMTIFDELQKKYSNEREFQSSPV